jgi:hypothetical protein
MRTKQLANILIKIVGLPGLIHSVPSIIAGMFSIEQVSGINLRGNIASYAVVNLVTYLVLAAICIYLIFKSREVAGFLFKGEVE